MIPSPSLGRSLLASRARQIFFLPVSVKENSPEGFSVPGASNWTICSLLGQICYPNFSTFPLSSWEANSYYPREGKAEKGKMEFTQPECKRGILVLGEFKLDHLQHAKPILFNKFSNFSTFILAGQFVLPQRGEGRKRENGILTT